MTANPMTKAEVITKAGTVHATVTGHSLDGRYIGIRYWIHDPNIDRRRPIETMATYCLEHNHFYADDDFPDGCPECISSEATRMPC